MFFVLQRHDEDSKTKNLQKALLEYLVYNAQNDPALVVSKKIFVRFCGQSLSGRTTVKRYVSML